MSLETGLGLEGKVHAGAGLGEPCVLGLCPSGVLTRVPFPSSHFHSFVTLFCCPLLLSFLQKLQLQTSQKLQWNNFPREPSIVVAQDLQCAWHCAGDE